MFHRTGLTFGILFLFIGMGIIPSIGINVLEKSTVSTLDGNTLYVGGSGEGNYTKIQDAIDNATDGDTVFVYDYSSPYNEFVWINKSINLVGEDRNTTIIDGGGTGYVVVVYITVDNVSVNGFTIYNCSEIWYYGIIINESSNIVVRGNIIANNWCGILDSPYSSNNKVYGNIIINCVTGIRLDGSRATIMRNTISNHTFGISLQSSSNVIENNTIFLPQKPELPHNTWGISLLESYKNIVKGNTITNHLWGIQLLHSSNNVVTENVITNHYFSVSLNDASENDIYGNRITNCYWYGLRLVAKSNNNTIVRNTIANSSEYGVYIENSYRNRIKENNFIENNISAYFENSLLNRWMRNYWDRPRLLPYPIFGKMKLGNITFPWMNFDWRPARKPYDVGV